MNRFFYHLIFVTMITNVVATVPKILLSNSTNGVIISMILAIIAGVIFTYVIASFFNKFPGQGLPELMKKHTSNWLRLPVTFYLAIMFYLGGLVTFTTYVFLLITFLTPEMSIIVIGFSVAIVVTLGILVKTNSVLYSAETVLLLFSPLIIYLIIKSYTSPKMNWDFVRVAIMHSNEFPDYSGFTASWYIFVGVSNLVIFNRVFKSKQKIGIKEMVVIALSGTFVLFTTYFIPIGMTGFQAVGDLIYPWISTSDSLRMKYGIVERALFVYLLFFFAVSILSIVIHWYVALKLFSSIFHFDSLKWKNKNLTSYLFIVVFGLFAIYATTVLTVYQLFSYSKLLYDTMPIFFAVLLISFTAVKRGLKSQ